VATLDWLARPLALIEITGEIFGGVNAAGLGGLRQGFTVSPTGVAAPVHANGGWGQVAFIPNPRLSLHLYGGEESDSGGLVAGNVSRNLIYAANVIYKIAPNILTALEIAQIRTDYVVSGQRLNNHYDLALGYLF
jgi:hypothetical protein